MVPAGHGSGGAHPHPGAGLHPAAARPQHQVQGLRHRSVTPPLCRREYFIDRCEEISFWLAPSSTGLVRVHRDLVGNQCVAQGHLITEDACLANMWAWIIARLTSCPVLPLKLSSFMLSVVALTLFTSRFFSSQASLDVLVCVSACAHMPCTSKYITYTLPCQAQVISGHEF